MKRSPLLLIRMPPSPRTPSVISTPAPDTPVGWNCQNSMSSSGRPARAAMPMPSPVLMQALVDAAQLRPVDDLRRFAAHEFDRILAAQVIAALDGSEHVPVPAVFAHVAERCAESR